MSRTAQRTFFRPSRQSGLTLVELMVAMLIGLFIAIAAVSALIVGRIGYTSVDSASLLRENGRFAVDLLQRIAAQAGYEDVASGVTTKAASVAWGGEDPEPDVVGYDDAVFATNAFPPVIANGSRPAACGAIADSSCVNGSDVVVFRFHGSSAPAGAADGSIINCGGIPEALPAATSSERAYSVFHVARSSAGEPTLMCSYRNAGGGWSTQPLVSGVESFQVLYGTDGVTPGAVPVMGSGIDTVPERYLRASQLVVAGNPEATRRNWRRVRSLRIGLLMRAATAGAVDRTATGRTYYPLSQGLSTSDDAGTALVISADGRLRQELSFTVHLRNPQGAELES